jgi:hypothetical protein
VKLNKEVLPRKINPRGDAAGFQKCGQPQYSSQKPGD